jgi:hypothetical protein
MPEPLRTTAAFVDMSSRVQQTVAITGSPATNAETVIATLTLPASALGNALVTGVLLNGWAAFTVGTSGTAATMRIRQTGTSGTLIVSTGAVTGGISAANLVTLDAMGIDTNTTAPAAVYVLTLQITAGAAASTVSATQLVATLV